MKASITLCLAMLSAVGSAEVRLPAVAGSFYSDDPAVLRSEVTEMLEEAGEEASGAPARALIVPHAGYVFSGPTAASAFARLPREGIRRVILLGPSHHFSYSGGALPEKGVTAFATPIGAMPLDLEAINRLRGDSSFQGPAKAHGPEHSLEVELPFLRLIAPEAKLVPVAIGGASNLETCFAVARALSELLDPQTVVVASSDFTHHGARYGWSPYDGPDLPDTLLAIGRKTVERAVAMDPRGFLKQVEVSGDTVCGARPVTVLAALLESAFSGSGEVLGVTTSGHVSGSFDMSVTYAAAAFVGDWSSWGKATAKAIGELGTRDGEALTALARASLQSYLHHDTSVADWFETHPNRAAWHGPAGAFVTLNNTGSKVRTEGRLRACMGVVEANQPLLDAVIQGAAWAAQDPRFPPLKPEELDKIEIEVSVLSPMTPVRSHRFIKVGTHGVLLEKHGRRALFLPQVATEQGWTRDEMLSQLAVKAGLERKAWESGARFQVFTAQVFSEGH